MIKKTVPIFKVIGGPKEVEYPSMEKAIEAANTIHECFGDTYKLKIVGGLTKEVYEIEVGDQVNWIDHNGNVKHERTDVVTEIIEDMYGVTQYLTKELDGKRIGLAYGKDLFLIV
jgi:uncharacterized protein YebE (UPF0316 family)